MRPTTRIFLLVTGFVSLWPFALAESRFPLVKDGKPVDFLLMEVEAPQVARALGDIINDMEKVTGLEGYRLTNWPEAPRSLVVAGTIGSGGAVDRLVKEGRFDPSGLIETWESFVIEGISHPDDPEQQMLVVAGSDKRGTIYGLYELSRAMGISPWYWWADVTPEEDPAAAIPTERQLVGPPSVKYRGIFVNDEDWALWPWARKSFDPELGDIGPKTYARVFELLLRLRGNTLWPAMHAVSRPFNEDMQNAELADAYGIVMSSSHAEPMLRNNVREWTAPHEDYNFQTNREGVLDYWEERVRSNGQFENVYTLGMRGIHDSGMQGDVTLEERLALLEDIFSEQRDILKRHVDPEVETIPQMFVAYKEVLELYRAGLEVPPDVTIVWPDDNFGYIRDFATLQERFKRPGGFGIYYHISYLGRPMAYLWLNTTPPALIWEELAKAHAHGADRIWILNVGDIKPAEIGIDFFFRLAWETPSWTVDRLPDFLTEWSRETFGDEFAQDIADILDAYYLLNFRRKPEHLQYHLPLQPLKDSPLTDAEIAGRLDAFGQLETQVVTLRENIPDRLRDAWFQLVEYPVLGSVEANRRYFWTERYRRMPSHEASEKAHRAQARLEELTRFYNEEIAGGKWRHFMALEPADDDWRSMRIAPLELPPLAEELAEDVTVMHSGNEAAATPEIVLDADASTRRISGSSGSWKTVPGLGRSGIAMTVLPFDGPEWGTKDAPEAAYSVESPRSGTGRLVVEILPTFPLKAGEPLRLRVAVNDGMPMELILTRVTGSPDWAEGVLSGHLKMETPVTLRAGNNEIRVIAVDRSVVVDRLRLEWPE